MLSLPELDAVEHRFVDAGGLRTHVAEAGDGEPVVMLHGWPQHWYQWRFQIPPLAERFRVICPDLRGCGWSEAPPDGYLKEELADDVVRLLDALELERVRLVGHDWGGWVGFLLALRHPERIERYLALNIPHPWGRLDARTIRSAWRFWYMALISTPGLGVWVVQNQPQLIGRLIRDTAIHPEAWSDEDLAAYCDQFREPERARATVEYYRLFLTRELPEVARGRYRRMRLTIPTLLLFGVADPAIHPDLLRGYEPYADDMTVELVLDSGHFIGEEKPELVTERALEFFAG